MRLKLFLASVFVLLCFVAYQKYTEYSTLKSVNSYESCIAAKGSTIQESYPATCITRLGTHFTQQTHSSDQDIINLVKQSFPELKSISSDPPKFGSNSYVNIKQVDKEWRLRFYLGSGDCPAGCLDSHEWYFIVDSNYKATKVGEYTRTFVPKTNSYTETGIRIANFTN